MPPVSNVSRLEHYTVTEALKTEACLDRVAPSKRPEGRNSGTQTWSDLLFCHWPAHQADLRKCVPEPLELDSFDGQYFVGLVAFRMVRIRPAWWPQGHGLNFLETNVRTYVVHRGIPGVYFISLDANSMLAILGARWGWGFPYRYARMKTQRPGSSGNGSISYWSARPSDGSGHDIVFRPAKHLGPSRPDTLEHFLLERYHMMIAPSGKVLIGQVHHQPYDAYLAELDHFEEQLVCKSGLPAPDGLPPLVHYCPGTDTEVFRLRPPN